MSLEANKAIVRRFYEEGWSQGRLEVVDALFSPRFAHRSPAALPPGEAGDRGQVKGIIARHRTALPDLRVTVEDLLAEGDRVAARLTYRGTQTGEWRHPHLGRHAPTGKAVIWTAISIFRLADGQIVELWSEPDRLGRL